MEPETPPTHRKRGAPLGNRNRLLHGAYARPPASGASSAASATLTLEAEIAFLRAYIQRLALVGATHPDWEGTFDTLRLLNAASNTLLRLIHTGAWLRTSGAALALPDRLDKTLDTLRFVSESYNNLRSPSPQPDPEPAAQALAPAGSPGLPLAEVLAGLAGPSSLSLLSPHLLAELSDVLEAPSRLRTASPPPRAPAGSALRHPRPP